MRRYQKWLSLGLLALTPGITLAGPFSSKKSTSAAAPSAKSAAASNQEMALKIKAALQKAQLTGYEMDIAFQGGVATLTGMVSSPDQKQAATRACASVKGVVRVDNQLKVAEPMPRSAVQQAALRQPAAAPARRVRPANYQAGIEGAEPSQSPGTLRPEPMGRPVAPGPGYAPGATASHAMYNQPNFPETAWPSYAQYPNYAAVTYPTQYAASAWPYIGPFYPYPQVPLGWRKATLEWDDGYWNLSFAPRTDRWWWFLDWRNW